MLRAQVLSIVIDGVDQAVTGGSLGQKPLSIVQSHGNFLSSGRSIGYKTIKFLVAPKVDIFFFVFFSLKVIFIELGLLLLLGSGIFY